MSPRRIVACEVTEEKSNLINSILPESITSSLENKSYIFYCWGHSGFSWSLVCLFNNSYKIYNGSTIANKTVLLENIDTANFVNRYNQLLKWGLDTLPLISTNMTPVYRNEYWPISNTLVAKDNMRMCYFSSNDAIGFSGSDSMHFNEKFRQLSLLMLWLSDQGIRDVLQLW